MAILALKYPYVTTHNCHFSVKSREKSEKYFIIFSNKMEEVLSELKVSQDTTLSEFENFLKRSNSSYWKIYSSDPNTKIYALIFHENHGEVYLKYTFYANVIYNINKTYLKNPKSLINKNFMIIILKDGVNIESLINDDKSYTYYNKLKENTYQIHTMSYEKIKNSDLIEGLYYMEN